MSLVFTLKLICDLCFYLTFGGFICALITGNGLLAAIPYLVGCAVVSCFFYNKGKLKYLGLIFLILAVYVVRDNLLNYLFLLPALAYSVYYVNSLPFEITRMEYADIFNLFLKLSVPAAFITILISFKYFESVCAPYAVGFLLFSVMLMRMLRHDESVLEERRFKLVNSLSVAGVFVLGAIISSEYFLGLIAALFKAVYFTAVAPVLTFILSLIIYILWPLVALLSKGEENKIPPQDVTLMTGEDFLGVGEVNGPSLGTYILMCIVIAGFLAFGIFLLYRLFKRLIRTYGSSVSSGAREERTVLAPDLQTRRDLKTDNQIRRIYKKFMKVCLRGGVVLNPSTTTEDIAYSAGNVFGEKESSYTLRDIYIKSRYGEKPTTKDDIKECRNIYNLFKKKGLY